MSEQSQSIAQGKEEGMSTLLTCGFALPTDEYKTVFTNFPGTNCTPRWSTEGDFFTTMSLYNSGKKLGEIGIKHCDQTGYLHADVDDLADLMTGKIDGILVMENRHTKTVPLDMYMFHTHRKTGMYVSYPIATFMGNQIYGFQESVFENTQFWPGIVANEHSESCVCILNPYTVNMAYQFYIYPSHGDRKVSEVYKTRGRSYSIHRVEEVFPEVLDMQAQSGQLSLCVAAQYKLVCYYMIRNRLSGAYTTIDHLHNYWLV